MTPTASSAANPPPSQTTGPYPDGNSSPKAKTPTTHATAAAYASHATAAKPPATNQADTQPHTDTCAWTTHCTQPTYTQAPHPPHTTIPVCHHHYTHDCLNLWLTNG